VSKYLHSSNLDLVVGDLLVIKDVQLSFVIVSFIISINHYTPFIEIIHVPIWKKYGKALHTQFFCCHKTALFRDLSGVITYNHTKDV
jgi:hypothetical protein